VAIVEPRAVDQAVDMVVGTVVVGEVVAAHVVADNNRKRI